MPEPRRHALVLGIDRYPGMAEEYQLKGCVNDAELTAQELRGRFGFDPADTVVLTNEAATRDGILAEMAGLRQRVRRDETVVVTYSGHGSWIPNPEANKPNGRDETIVPFDSGRGEHPCRDIRDGEIYDWLLALSEVTPRITLIFDSCFSGSIVRDGFGARVRQVPPHHRPPEPPSAPSLVLRGRAGEPPKGPSGFLPLSERYVLLAGCRHDEFSNEHAVRPEDGGEPVHHGALTFFLWKELAETRPGESYRDVFERAGARVTAHYSRQHPQMEGARDRELFGSTTLPPHPFLPVRERDGTRITLGGGAAHGLTAGSEWAIHAQGTRSLDASPRRALATVRRVEAVRAEAEIHEEDLSHPAQPGDRAFEHAHRYGEMRLVVEIDAPKEGRKELARRVRGSSLLRLARKGESGQARVYLVGPRPKAGAGDPVPQLAALARPVWAVIGEDGDLLMPTVPADDAVSFDRLLDNLRARARYGNVLRIENRDPESRLRGRIGFRLLRQKEGRWEPAAAGIAYEEGDRLVLEVENQAETPVYVSILDLGLSGRIGLLHPVRGASEPLAAGRTLQIGVRPGEELELYIPAGFPFAGDPARAEGTEHLVLLATTEEADFESLEQAGYRGALRKGSARGTDPLAELLQAALAEGALREIRPVVGSPGADWTTITRSFLVQRKGRP